MSQDYRHKTLTIDEQGITIVEVDPWGRELTWKCDASGFRRAWSDAVGETIEGFEHFVSPLVFRQALVRAVQAEGLREVQRQAHLLGQADILSQGE